MRKLLWFLTVSTGLAEGEFGQCLYNISIPDGGRVQCDPPNSLPQICTFVCDPGYYSVQTDPPELTCENALCQNRCSVVQKTCSGTVPVHRVDAMGRTYTDYVREERACCTLEKPEAGWCDLGACTGTCADPGIYAFDARACPDVCIPYRDTETPGWGCSPCTIPAIPDIVVSPQGNPPVNASLECPKGTWGTSSKITCDSRGSWDIPTMNCTTCIPPPYPLEELDRSVLEIVESPGYVHIQCNPEFAPSSWTFQCDPTTGEWPYWEDITCLEWPTPSPSPSESPSNPPTTTPSPSKSPRAPKVKGSRAPTPPPKIRGSVLASRP